MTRVPFAQLAVLIREVLASGGRVRLQVEGDSMHPWLHNGEDDVILYVMHRVSRRKRGEVWLLGDAQTGEEGPWRDGQVIALVERVVRRGRELDMTSTGARFFARVWLACRPFRPCLLQMLRWTGRQRQRIKGVL